MALMVQASQRKVDKMKTLPQKCYEAVTAFEQEVQPEGSFLEWNDLEDSARKSYEETAAFYASNPEAMPEQGHQRWRLSRRSLHWQPGAVRQVIIGAEDDPIRLPLQRIAMSRSRMTPEECRDAEIAAAKIQHADDLSLAKTIFLEACDVATTPAVKNFSFETGTFVEAEPAIINQAKVDAARSEMIQISKQSVAWLAKEVEFIENVFVERLKARPSQITMIHPCLFAWRYLSNDQKMKFQIFHDTVCPKLTQD